MSGNLSLRKTSQVGIFGSRGTSQHGGPALAPGGHKSTAATCPPSNFRDRGSSCKTIFPIQASPSSHGKRCCRRIRGLWILPTAVFLQGMHSTEGKSSQVSPGVGRLKLLNIWGGGKNQLSFGLIHSHSLFSSTNPCGPNGRNLE